MRWVSFDCGSLCVRQVICIKCVFCAESTYLPPQRWCCIVEGFFFVFIYLNISTAAVCYVSVYQTYKSTVIAYIRYYSLALCLTLITHVTNEQIDDGGVLVSDTRIEAIRSRAHRSIVPRRGIVCNMLFTLSFWLAKPAKWSIKFKSWINIADLPPTLFWWGNIFQYCFVVDFKCVNLVEIIKPRSYGYYIYYQVMSGCEGREWTFEWFKCGTFAIIQ